jgi:hypothetical protein
MNATVPRETEDREQAQVGRQQRGEWSQVRQQREPSRGASPLPGFPVLPPDAA